MLVIFPLLSFSFSFFCCCVVCCLLFWLFLEIGLFLSCGHSGLVSLSFWFWMLERCHLEVKSLNQLFNGNQWTQSNHTTHGSASSSSLHLCSGSGFGFGSGLLVLWSNYSMGQGDVIGTGCSARLGLAWLGDLWSGFSHGSMLFFFWWMAKGTKRLFTFAWGWDSGVGSS